MSKIKIVTDSTVDLPKETIAKYNIEVVPLSVLIDGTSYLDGVDITPTQFLEKLKQTDDMPKTSTPSVGKFTEVYDRLSEDGSEIISIHITSGMSGTFDAAQQAAEQSKGNVSVIDSRFISCALGFQVVEAAKMAMNNFSVGDIINKLKKVRENTNLYIMVDTLDFLVKGGRIGRGQALVGSLLNIKPIASLDDGVYTPVKKVRSYKQFVSYIQERFQTDMKGKIPKSFAIAHIGAQKLAEETQEAIAKLQSSLEFSIIDTGPVIGSHTGPGAIAVMYQADVD